jgi:hypothetical protein
LIIKLSFKAKNLLGVIQTGPESVGDIGEVCMFGSVLNRVVEERRGVVNLLSKPPEVLT